MELITWLLANYQMILANLVLIAGALMAIFMAIPGEHPDKEIKAFLDFISKFSRK